MFRKAPVVLALVAVLALAACGSSQKPANNALGGGDCIRPPDSARLCGELAVEWCNDPSHDWSSLGSYGGDCAAVTGKSTNQPTNTSTASSPSSGSGGSSGGSSGQGNGGGGSTSTGPTVTSAGSGGGGGTSTDQTPTNQTPTDTSTNQTPSPQTPTDTSTSGGSGAGLPPCPPGGCFNP